MLFNNCRSRRHAEHYGAEAFFDIRLDNAQKKQAPELEPGQHCCVATPVEGGEVEFAWFSFSHERVMEMPDEPGAQVRVLFGQRLGAERMPQSKAVRIEPYAALFNIHGHFKRLTAVRPKVVCRVLRL